MGQEVSGSPKQQMLHDHQYLTNVTPDDIPQEGQELLQIYSGLKRDKLLPHILQIVSDVCSS